MWFRISDVNDEVVFFANCTIVQSEALLQKIQESCGGRKLLLKQLDSKPEGIVVYGLTRVDIPEKNIFVGLFVRGGRKWKKTSRRLVF